jgi:hypothetical protein
MNFGLYFAFTDHSLLLVQTNYGYVRAFMVDVVIVQLSQLVDVFLSQQTTLLGSFTWQVLLYLWPPIPQ